MTKTDRILSDFRDRFWVTSACPGPSFWSWHPHASRFSHFLEIHTRIEFSLISGAIWEPKCHQKDMTNMMQKHIKNHDLWRDALSWGNDVI